MNKILKINKVKILLICIVFLISPIFNHLIKADGIPKSTKEWIEIAKRIEKIDQISDLKDKKSKKAILNYLNDKEPHVREIAAIKIGYIGDIDMIKHLSKKDTHWFVNRAFRGSIEMIETRRKLEECTVKGKTNKQVISEILKKAPECIGTIFNLYVNSGKIIELKEIGKELPEIRSTLGKFEFNTHKALAKHNLDTMSKSERIEKSIDILINSLQVECYKRKASILALIEIGNECIPHILSILDKGKIIPEKNPPPYELKHTIFSSLIGVLKCIPDNQSIKKLEELSNNKVEYVSKMAKESLEWVRSGVPYPFKYQSTLFISEDDIPPDWEEK